MSQPSAQKPSALLFNSSSPGLLEQLGVKYYVYLQRKHGTQQLRNLSIDELPDDIALQTLAENITGFAAIIAFAIGALTTFVTVWITWTYQSTLPSQQYYLLYGSVLLLMLVVELAVLFWLGLKTVYSLACLTGQHQNHTDSLQCVETSVPNILARAALELSDPVIHYMGIDPLKHLSKSKLLFVALLYKAKVVLSSVILRFILVDIFGKGSARASFNWIGIPVTGFWDAYTIYKVAQEARLRLFGHKLVEHIISNILREDILQQLSPLAREGAVRAVATMMVLAQHYHPNMLILLMRLSDTFAVQDNCDYDNWDDFLAVLSQVQAHERYFLLDLLCVAAAFEGKLSRLEKHHLPEAFQEYTEVYLQRTQQLADLLLAGRLHAAKELCTLDFNPG